MPGHIPTPTRSRWLSADTPLVQTLGTAVAFGLLVGLIIIGLVGFGSVPVSSAADGRGAAPTAVAPVTFDIELGDIYVKPSSIDVPAGAKITINVTNVGSMEHSMPLKGEPEQMVAPGKSAVLNWGPLTESTTAACTVPGHADAGMVLAVNVIGSDKAAAGAKSASAEPSGAKIDPAAKPSPDWKPFDPTVKPAASGTVHEETITVTEQKVEVAPGVKQQLWTYNGTSPGPILRGKVGDTFKLTVVNKGSMNHSLDLHASKVAPDVEMRAIKPGESLVYEFKAQYSGVFSYHCGVDPMIQHMGNGMFGAIIIDPPDLAPVDKEFIFIQSELNLGAEGEIMDVKKMMSGDNDAVVFNGYFNQYAFSPLKVDPSDRIRAYVVNLAVNEDLSFHVVGSIFDTVWKEGAYLLKPDNANHGGSQALDLATTQGGFVEFTLDKAGSYPFVNHQMRNLSRGALGVFVSEESKEAK